MSRPARNTSPAPDKSIWNPAVRERENEERCLPPGAPVDNAYQSDGGGRAPDDSGGPLHQAAGESEDMAKLELWHRFHLAMEQLPEKEHEVALLLWYGGIGQKEAAVVLGVSERTVKRWWRSARLLPNRALHGQSPE